MASNTGSDLVQFDPAGRIGQDVPCIQCGYNLRTLLAEQACPECGQPVAQSLQRDRLRFCDPRWLRRVAGGTTWILVGGVGLLTGAWVIPFLHIVVSVLGIPSMARDAVVLLVILGTFVTGVCLATWPEPGLAVIYRSNKARIAARVPMAGLLLLMLAVQVCEPRTGTPVRPATASDMRWWQLVSSLEALLCSGGLLALCIYMSGLGRRAGAFRLARFASWAGAGVALLGLVMLSTHVWRGMHVQQFLAPGPNSIAKTLAAIELIAVVSGLALLLLVAILYGRLLRREARLAKQQVHDTTTAGAIT